MTTSTTSTTSTTDASLDSATRYAALTAGIARALRSAGRLDPHPLVLFDREGHSIASSRPAGELCPLAAEAGSLTFGGEDSPRCPCSDCPNQPAFRARALPLDGRPGWLVHCGTEDRLSFFAELLVLGEALDTEQESVLAALSRVHDEINWLFGVGDLLEHGMEPDKTIVKLFTALAKIAPIGDAEAWVPDHQGGAFGCLVRLRQGKIQRVFDLLEIDQPARDAIREAGITVVRSSDASGGITEALRQPLADIGRPAVVVPLEARGRLAGFLLLRLSRSDQKLDSGHLVLMRSLARQAGLFLKVHSLVEELRANEGLKREIEIAREIQHGLFPQVIPKSPAYDLWGGCVTAARVGGDYYDLFERESDLGLLIADVSGHSVASGLIGMSFRSSFRHYLAEGVPIDEVFTRVNRSMFEELHLSGHFLSAFYAVFDPQSRTLRFINAGHNRPFVIRAESEKALELDDSGLLIGILPETEYPVGQVTLEPGDVLVLYTDGIVEAENQHHEEFGIGRLQAAARRYARRSAKQLYHLLLKEMYVFQDEHFNKDDVTLVLLEVK